MNSSHQQDDELKWINWTINGLGFVTLATVGAAIYFLFISPLGTEADRLISRVDSVAHFLESSQAIQVENDRLVTQVDDEQEQWNNLLSQIPATAGESGFLAQVTTLSQKNDLKISNFSPGASREINTCKQLQIQMTISGTYLNLCHFLDGLKSVSRVTMIDNLVITTSNRNHLNTNYTVIINLQLAYGFQNPKVVAKL